MLLNVENRRLKTGGETLNPAVFYTHTHTHTHTYKGSAEKI